MTNQIEAAIENQAELIKEEITNALHSMEVIKQKVAEVSTTRRTFGKTIAEWNQELALPIAHDADPGRVKYYLSRLSHNLDIAYNNLSKIKLMYYNYKLSYAPALSNEIAGQANHKGRKVAPALDTMSHVAANQLGDRSTVAIEFEAFIGYWQDTVWRIKDQVSIVKMIGMTNGTMAKIGEVFDAE